MTGPPPTLTQVTDGTRRLPAFMGYETDTGPKTGVNRLFDNRVLREFSNPPSNQLARVEHLAVRAVVH